MQQQQTFGQVLRAEIRAEMGRQDINQTELARRLGWHQSVLSRRLAGKIGLSIFEVEQIAAALDVPITQFGWAPEARRSKAS
jgi:transcriptional regulator with XRE-family HTH domain